jgi:hypothetical protein
MITAKRGLSSFPPAFRGTRNAFNSVEAILDDPSSGWTTFILADVAFDL